MKNPEEKIIFEEITINGMNYWIDEKDLHKEIKNAHCFKCEEFKPLDQFVKYDHFVYQSICKDCNEKMKDDSESDLDEEEKIKIIDEFISDLDLKFKKQKQIHLKNDQMKPI